MPKTPLVSILIPAYNAEAFLAQTIRSAQRQTWPNMEVIVVDDGSKDGTLAVARQFESSKVKVVTQKNGGAPAARNRAYAESRGNYIQWLDADDLLAPDKIAIQMEYALALNDPRALLSCAYGTFYYRPQKATFVETSLWRDLTPIDYFLTRFRDNVCFQTDAWLVSRELTEAAGPWSDLDSPDDDGEYFCRVAMKSSGVRFVKGARTYYRIGNYGSLNNGRSQRALSALFLSKVKCIRYLLEIEDSERTRAASVQLLQDWMPYFYLDRQDLVSQARQLAAELGGTLDKPALKWKYRPLEWVAGYTPALRASRVLPRLRSQAKCSLDKFLLQWSSDREAALMATHQF